MIYAIIAIGVLKKNKQIVVMGCVIGIALRIVAGFCPSPTIYVLPSPPFIAYQTLFVLFFIFFILAMVNTKNSILWCVLSCVPILGELIVNAVVSDLFFNDVFFTLLLAIGTILAGVVFSTREKTKTNKDMVARQSADLSNIDKLVKLKSLLDSGAITQEEFDEKKKDMMEGQQ